MYVYDFFLEKKCSHLKNRTLMFLYLPILKTVCYKIVANILFATLGGVGKALYMVARNVIEIACCSF